MAWRVWGEALKTADFSGTPRVHQPIQFNNDDQNFVLKAIRTWLILYNIPTFTSVEMRVYANQGGLPGAHLYTSSNNFTLAELTSSDNAAREVYFEFDNAFDYNDTYHFVLWINGYTGTSASHVAWKKAFPDPQYSAVVGPEKLASCPFDVSVIGSDL